MVLYREEGFVRMGRDPGVMQQLRGTGEVLRNLHLPECHCPSDAERGGVGFWSWMCREA